MDSENARAQAARFSQLKHDFENYRALAQRARTRAVRAAEQTAALRSLLTSRNGAPRISADQQKQWTAATRAVAEMTRERDRVLGTVSHEMRQALTAALAAEQILVQHGKEPAAARAANVLNRQLLHLSKLVELLLDYSRLMGGTGGLETDWLDLRDVVAETIEGGESLAREQRIELSVSLSPEPQIVHGDPTRLRQLLSNLLHNAFRYTPAGGSIHCGTETVGEAAHVIVSDTGAGIAPEDLPLIFEPFTRKASEGPGLGVGLSIARRIAHLHGGYISAHSDGPGQGTTFKVVLPLAQNLT